MNTRERFLGLVHFDKPDRTLKWEMGYWGGTVRRWYTEGLPKKKGIPDSIADGSALRGENMLLDAEVINPVDAACRDKDVAEYFGHDEPIWRLPLNNYLYPLFEKQILEDHDTWILYKNEYGVIVKDQKNRCGFPHWVETPVKTRDDWEKLKSERLSPKLKNRLPENWDQWKRVFKNRTFPLVIGGYPAGFYGTARFLLGEERVMFAFYDLPELMHDIMNYLADFWVSLYDQALSQVAVDGILFWEDMCYKNGPLISPEMFRHFILPGYKKVTECLRSHGVSTIMVDTDGHCWDLIPLFMEGGVNLICPFERAAGMDITEVRKAFPNLAIAGGIDKTKLTQGRESIDKELEFISWMIQQGGFIPHIDHQVPPEVSWENFIYYRQKLNRIIENSNY